MDEVGCDAGGSGSQCERRKSCAKTEKNVRTSEERWSRETESRSGVFFFLCKFWATLCEAGNRQTSANVVQK